MIGRDTNFLGYLFLIDMIGSFDIGDHALELRRTSPIGVVFSYKSLISYK
jgi:hypothetical protein